MSERTKTLLASGGAVLGTLASLWIIGVGFYLQSAFFALAGFFFLLATGICLMIYLLRGTTWRS